MPDKKRIAFEIIQDFLVSLTLTITALLVSKADISFLLILKETCFAWLVNLILGFTIPEGKFGEAISKKLKLKEVPSFLLTMFIIVLINVIGISACVVLKNVGFNKQFFDVWLSLFPILLGVGYIAAMIWYPVTNGIVRAVFKKESK